MMRMQLYPIQLKYLTSSSISARSRIRCSSNSSSGSRRRNSRRVHSNCNNTSLHRENTVVTTKSACTILTMMLVPLSRCHNNCL